MIELVIVLTILSLITVAVLPSLELTKRWNLERSAVKLRSDIRFIQSLSLAEGETYYIQLTPPNSYTVANGKDDRVIKSVSLAGVLGLEHNSSSRIVFNSNGKINTGRTITLYADGYLCKLEVRPVTGRVNRFNIEESTVY